MNTTQKLQHYIEEELKASMLYAELAKLAPNEEYRKLLAEMSADEKDHAENFNQVYRMLTGRSYTPNVAPPEIEDPFYEELRKRILAESADYKEYNDMWNMTDRNIMLKNSLFDAKTDENVHALHHLYMLSGLQ